MMMLIYFLAIPSFMLSNLRSNRVEEQVRGRPLEREGEKQIKYI